MKVSGRGPAMYPVCIRSMRKPDCSRSRIDRAIQVAATGESLPERRQACLATWRRGITRSAVLDEEQSARRPQHPPHLLKRTHDVRDRTQRPRDNDRINTLTVQRDVFGRSLQERPPDTSPDWPASRAIDNARADGSSPINDVEAV